MSQGRTAVHPFVARRGQAKSRRLMAVVATMVMSAAMVAPATMMVATVVIMVWRRVVVMVARRHVVLVVPAASISRSGHVRGRSIARVDGGAAIIGLGTGWAQGEQNQCGNRGDPAHDGFSPVLVRLVSR